MSEYSQGWENTVWTGRPIEERVEREYEGQSESSETPIIAFRILEIGSCNSECVLAIHCSTQCRILVYQTCTLSVWSVLLDGRVFHFGNGCNTVFQTQYSLLQISDDMKDSMIILCEILRQPFTV